MAPSAAFMGCLVTKRRSSLSATSPKSPRKARLKPFSLSSNPLDVARDAAGGPVNLLQPVHGVVAKPALASPNTLIVLGPHIMSPRSVSI